MCKLSKVDGFIIVFITFWLPGEIEQVGGEIVCLIDGSLSRISNTGFVKDDWKTVKVNETVQQYRVLSEFDRQEIRSETIRPNN